MFLKDNAMSSTQIHILILWNSISDAVIDWKSKVKWKRWIKKHNNTLWKKMPNYISQRTFQGLLNFACSLAGKAEVKQCKTLKIKSH